MAVFPGQSFQRSQVLGKAAPAKTASGINKTVTYPAVTSHADSDLVDISPHSLANNPYLVHKGYLCGKHCICSIFCHFGASYIHCNKPLMSSGEWFVKLFYYF